jgi:outer membrane immunogenic protein
MHRCLLVSAAALAFGIGAASAADLGAPPPAPIYTKAPAPVAYGWTGFYAGAEGGYGWSDPTVTFTGNDPLSVAALTGNFIGGQPMGPASFNNTGGFGGAEAGYNWQVGPSWLVGVETDFSGSTIKGQGSSSSIEQGPPASTFIQQITANQNIDWFGTVRARAGWLATPALLLYGTGGFAYGRVDETVNWGFNPGGTAAGLGNVTWVCPGSYGQCLYGTSSRIATGWTAGAGAEYKVPGTNVSFKLEYLFVDLGAGDTVVGTALTAVKGTIPGSFSAAYSATEVHTLKAGLNWHF